VGVLILKSEGSIPEIKAPSREALRESGGPDLVPLPHFSPGGKEEQGETTQTGEEGCGGFRNHGRGTLGAL